MRAKDASYTKNAMQLSVAIISTAPSPPWALFSHRGLAFQIPLVLTFCGNILLPSRGFHVFKKSGLLLKS